MSDVREVAVLGGGAWGTALAVHLARHSHARPRVALYIRSEEQMQDCRAALTNRRYLPDVPLPDSIALTSSLADVAGADLLFAATPVVELVPLAAALKAAGAADPAVKVYSVGIYEQSLTFYLRRPVTLVDYRDEFDFGLQQQPELAIPTIPAFVARWRADAAAGVRNVAIIRPELIADLKRQGVPLRIVAADSRRAVIANL